MKQAKRTKIKDTLVVTLPSNQVEVKFTNDGRTVITVYDTASIMVSDVVKWKKHVG